MGNFNDEPDSPREPSNIELAAAAIDPYLLNLFEDHQAMFDKLPKIMDPESANIIKRLWISSLRLAFANGVIEQAGDPGLVHEIKQKLTE